MKYKYGREGHFYTTFIMNSSVLYQYLCISLMSEYDLWWRVSSGLLFNEFKSRNSKLMEMNVPVKMFISAQTSAQGKKVLF